MSRGYWVLLVAVAWLGVSSALAGEVERTNLLLITVDDMGADSIGVYGSPVPRITPNIDQLAAQGLRFERAHVQVANCMPSRNVMWSGRYPHSNRVEGFQMVWDPGYPHLADLARDAGYFTAIRHKLRDSTPFYPHNWDLELDSAVIGKIPDKKDAESYGHSTSEGIRRAREAGQPFFLLINIADPHVPFFGLDRRGRKVDDPYVPSRIYRPEEVAVPGFLVDDPVVRGELAHYYSSVRRADDAVGHVLRALEESGQAGSTLVMLISDHGMPFPFAKTQLYHHSTLTPLIFRWPGVTPAGAADSRHMVAAVDLLPTLVEAVDLRMPEGVEGASFLPLLRGNAQAQRDRVFKAFNESSSGERRPMRAVETARFLYIFNPWSDGVRTMQSATSRTQTYRRMRELSLDDEGVARRLDLLRYRVPEEFYDVGKDPDCLVNLIDAPAYQQEIRRHRSMLEGWMRDTADPLLPVFEGRRDKAVLAAFMQQQDEILQKRRLWTKAIIEAMEKKAIPEPEK